MFRNLWSVLSYSRIPISVAARNSQVYRVRFLRPKSTTFFIFTGITGFFLCRAVVEKLEDGPIFVPLGFPQKQPQRKYQETDPVWKTYVKFNSDIKKIQAAKRKVADRLVDLLIESNKEKLGGNVQPAVVHLMINYPPPPLEYKRKGLRISLEENEEPTTDALGKPRRYRKVRLEWATRPVSHITMHRRSTVLYPSWMFSTLWASIKHTYSWLTSIQQNGQTLESLGGPRVLGSAAILHGFGAFKQELVKNYKVPPPPQGHVILDGMVTIVAEKMIVTVDVTASFNPETLGNFKLLRTRIRHAASHKRPALPPSPTEKILHKRIPSTVVKGLDGDPATIKAVAALQERSLGEQKKHVEKLKEEVEGKQPEFPEMKDVRGKDDLEKQKDVLEQGPKVLEDKSEDTHSEGVFEGPKANVEETGNANDKA